MFFLIPICVTVFALWFCYSFGQFLSFLFSIKNEINSSNTCLAVLEKVFLGLISSVLIYSIYITKGISINVFFIFLLVLFFLFPKVSKSVANDFKPNSNSKNLEFFLLIKTTCVLLFFTLLTYFLFNDFELNLVATNTSPDHYYYGYYATKMVEFGIEGTNFTLSTLTSPANQFRTPYHYFDFWMIALLQKMSFGTLGLAELYSFCFIPFILALAWLSLMAVFGLFKSKISIIDFIIVLLLTAYLSPTEFHFIDGINLIHAPKLYCSVIVSSIAFCYFFNNQITKGFLILGALPLMNILALPVICVSAGLYSIFLLYKKKNKEGLFLLISFFVLGLSILLFYQIFGSTSNKVNIANYNFKGLLIGGGVFGLKIFARLLFAIIPILLFSLLLFKKIKTIFNKNKSLIGVSVLIILVGYFESILLWNVYDSGQIRSYPSNIFIGLMLIAIVAVVSKEVVNFPKNLQLKFTYFLITFCSITCFISLVIINKREAKATFVSKQFIEEIKKNVEPNTIYGYIYNPNRVFTSLWANNYNLVLDNLNFLALVPHNLTKVSLNTFINLDSVPNKFKGLIPIIEKGDLHKFSSNIKATNLNQAQKEFIKTNKIRYLITSKQENLPDEIRSLVEKTIEDTYSKNCFFVLKDF